MEKFPSWIEFSHVLWMQENYTCEGQVEVLGTAQKKKKSKAISNVLITALPISIWSTEVDTPHLVSQWSTTAALNLQALISQVYQKHITEANMLLSFLSVFCLHNATHIRTTLQPGWDTFASWITSSSMGSCISSNPRQGFVYLASGRDGGWPDCWITQATCRHWWSPSMQENVVLSLPQVKW